MFTMLKKVRSDKSGATAIEYGLIAALIGVVIIGGVGVAGTSLDDLFTTISTNLSNSASTGTGTAQ